MTDLEAFDAFERTGWQAKAGAYAEGVTALTRHTAEPLLDAAGVRAGGTVLDVGTGPGVVAAAAARRGAAVVGVDVAPAMVDLARRAVPDGDFRVGSADALPLGDGEVDAAVGNFVLLHLAWPERAAAELFRVLRPGGRVALSVWDSLAATRALGVFADACAAAGAVPPPDLPNGPAFERFADDAELTGLLATAGFAEARVERVSWRHVVDPDEWWRAILAGTARTGPLISAQDEPTRARIRAAYDELVAAYREPDGRVALPAVAVIGSGVSPG